MGTIKLGNKEMTIPIIQGGMGVGVSLGNLAGTVASLGGMGVISGVGIGFREKDYFTNSLEKDKKALNSEIQKAREISKGKGLLGVNLMTAITNFGEMAQCASESGIDAIISGAGLPLKLPEFVKKETLIAPIVSSKRALELIVRTWRKKYSRYPDFVVVEGPEAGGHLGYKKEELEEIDFKDIVIEVLEYLRDLREEVSMSIPLFVAGGIRTGKERREWEFLGADGVQVATPFIATRECDVHDSFKQEIVQKGEEDLKIIQSPAGFPARAIENDFLKSIDYESVPKRKCINCLKTCDPRKTPYCIFEALRASAKGELKVVFSGTKIENITEIQTVKDVIDILMEES